MRATISRHKVLPLLWCLALVASLPPTATGCASEGGVFEEAGESMDEAIDETGDAVEDAAEEVGD